MKQLAINRNISLFFNQAQTHLKKSGNKLVINVVTKGVEMACNGLTG